MNNKDILKKMKNLPNNPASKDSPIFSGIPTAPTATLYDSSGKAENCNFSTPFTVVNTEEYPMTFGLVMSLGFKITL